MLCNQFLLLFIFVAVLKESVAAPKEKKVKECQDGYFLDGNKCQECGMAYVKPNVKIVNGVEAISGSWPSAVNVIYSMHIKELNKTFDIPCGGTLINRRTVLYAVHCVRNTILLDNVTYTLAFNEKYPTVESRIKVYIGAHNYTSNNDPNMITRKVSRIIQHENFSLTDFSNDIGLLVLSEPVPLNARINVACLPKRKSVTYPEVNRDVYAAGWGVTTELGGYNFSFSDVLYNVKLTVYDPQLCKDLYSMKDNNFDSQVCAGNWEGLGDTCSGDSGSALMVKEDINGKTKYVASALTSFGRGCSRPQTLGVYTRVSYYVDWIKKNSAI